MKTDYQEEIQQFLKTNYEPVHAAAHENEETEKKSISEIHNDICTILPKQWINESDIYDALQELNFKSFIYIIEPVTFKGDDNEDIVLEPGGKKLAYFLQPII